MNAALPLWATGLAVTIAVAAALLTRTPLEPKLTTGSTGWLFYLMLGTVYPIAALVLLRGGGLARAVTLALAGAGAGSMVLYVALAQRWIVLPFAALTLALGWPLLRERVRRRDLTTTGLAVLIAVTAWSVAAALAFQAPLHDWLTGRTPYANALQAPVVFFVATVLGGIAVFDRAAWPRPVWSERAALALGAAGILLAALRRDANLDGPMHVSFYVGPIELVRQGGWLLWDVPSQYGFGMVLANAAVPVPTSYAALAVLNAILLVVAAGILFALLRAGTKGPVPALFAGLTTIAAVFFVCGKYWLLEGAEAYPSVGPMRFIWCYVLLAIVVAEYAGRLSARRALAAGCIVYAAAFWWSAESAVYCSCIWLLAVAALAWRSGGLRGAVRWAAGAFGAVLAIAAAIAAVYAIGLHHLPDWYGFVEYALVYQGGASFHPMTILGAVWVLVLTFVVCTAVTLSVLLRGAQRPLPVLLAACGMQWSTMSYFIARSHDNNVCNLIPIELAVLAVALYVVRREPVDDATALFTRFTSVPVAAMTIGLAFSPAAFAARYLEPLTGPRQAPLAVFPRVPPDLERALQAQHIGPASPVLYQNAYLPPLWPSAVSVMPRQWVPIFPPVEFGVLPPAPDEPPDVDLAARRPVTGYMVEMTTVPQLPDTPPLHELLRSAFTETLVAGGSYPIYRYDPR